MLVLSVVSGASSSPRMRPLLVLPFSVSAYTLSRLSSPLEVLSSTLPPVTSESWMPPLLVSRSRSMVAPSGRKASTETEYLFVFVGETPCLRTSLSWPWTRLSSKL